MRPHSPDLINLSQPCQSLTLLDTDEDESELISSARVGGIIKEDRIGRDLGIREGRRSGPGAKGEGTRDGVRREGILIDLADGSSVVFRPNLAGHSNRAPSSRVLPQSRKAGETQQTASKHFPALGTASKRPLEPLVQLDTNRSAAPTFSPPYTPKSTSGPPRFSPTTPPCPSSVVSSEPILITPPDEVASLFTYHITRYPFPSLKPAERLIIPAEPQLDDPPLLHPDHIEYLVDLGDMGDEVDDQLVQGVSSVAIQKGVPTRSSGRKSEEKRGVQGAQARTGSGLSSTVNNISPLMPQRKGVDAFSRDTSPMLDFSQTPATTNLLASPYRICMSMPSPREYVPDYLIHPSPSDKLQTSIMTSWIATEPTKRTKEYIPALLEKTVLPNQSEARNNQRGCSEEEHEVRGRRLRQCELGRGDWSRWRS